MTSKSTVARRSIWIALGACLMCLSSGSVLSSPQEIPLLPSIQPAPSDAEPSFERVDLQAAIEAQQANVSPPSQPAGQVASINPMPRLPETNLKMFENEPEVPKSPVPSVPRSDVDSQESRLPQEVPTAKLVPPQPSPLLRGAVGIGLEASGSSPPANLDLDASGMLEVYQQQTQAQTDQQRFVIPNTLQGTQPAPELWWVPAVVSPPQDRPALYFGLQQLLDGAMLHSSRIRIVSTEPAIRRTEVTEEMAQFNWRRFVESRYDDKNDPIGNTLTTGDNSSRFLQQTASMKGGMRQRNAYGGELEISQNLQYQDNNSRFFVPSPQGTARLELQYTQPLLNGAGKAVNQSRILLADIQVGVADDQWYREVQDHLAAVTEAYWSLYLVRADYIQRKKLVDNTQMILDTLQARREFDAMQRQVLRAQATLAARQSELIRAAAAIRNAESRLRLLINDPALFSQAGAELTPTEAPMPVGVPLQTSEAMQLALANRRDISQAIRDVRSAGVKAGVARNQLLPKLDMVMSSYVAGLRGSGDIYSAFGNQFVDGRPGFAGAFLYESPLGNQAAEARVERSRLELVRAMAAFDWTVQQGLNEVEIAWREVETTHQEIQARMTSLSAATQEAAYLYDRWQTIPGVDISSVLLLEDLLESQTRVTEEERALVKSQVDYAMALVRLKQQMGTLLRVQGP